MIKCPEYPLNQLFTQHLLLMQMRSFSNSMYVINAALYYGKCQILLKQAENLDFNMVKSKATNTMNINKVFDANLTSLP